MKSNNHKKKLKLKAPDALVLIIILLALSALATHLLPTGEYTRVMDAAKGVEVIDPTSYHPIEKNPISLWGILTAIPRGLNESAEIINFLLIIGGVFGILSGTGALDSLLKITLHKLKGRERWIIPIVLLFWGLGGAIIGNFEECLAFLPLQITLCLALGFDSITGVALGVCGAGVGFIGAILNPFTIVLAQKIADVPTLSGIPLRVIAFSILIGATIIYIYIYGGKILKDPQKSLMYEIDLKSPFLENTLEEEEVNFTRGHKLSLLIFLIGIMVLVYGVIKYHFYLPEISAVFIAVGLLSGFLSGLTTEEMVKHFVSGAGSLVYAGLCVGFARSISIVMSDGRILDVIVQSFSNLIIGLPIQISAVGMFLFQSVINIFIPSGTGQAVVSMPIMTPLADIIGFTRQTAVLAFQFGDGITNLLTPTGGALMAALAIGRIPYTVWIKWIWKLLLIWYIICSLLLVYATYIGYGPI
ncbi:MAG: TIGR00366 family protein [Tissierellia bacterium]|nr:TIGR00366 family protein [Tissierellia bacterium]